jgi:endoglucanase
MAPNQDRRSVLSRFARLAATLLLARTRRAGASGRRQPAIPRWRGFNLIELFNPNQPAEFRESDFLWMARWGLNFARLPCSYWVWSNKDTWKTINESKLAPLDRGIALGRQYRIHINLCLHRIPGYCASGAQLEPYKLFGSPRESMQRALDAAVYQWHYLAKRYKHIPSKQLSFDLFNEPPFMTDQSRYVEIARTLIAAIRDVSPNRLIFADGMDLGQTPVLGLIDEGIVQSTRGYLPKMVSHYEAGWVPADQFESFAKPTWPMVDRNGVLWNRDKLRSELITKWQPLVSAGVPIHVGEWGCFNKTPHNVCLAWMTDLLSLWKEAGWGWALWNLRGAFGVVDSGRSDVRYEHFDGHALDRKMLDLLLAH